MATTTAKVNQRKGHRAFVTRTISTAKEALSVFSESENKGKLREFRQCLVEKLDVLKELDDQILGSLESEDDIGREIDNSSEFRPNMQEIVMAIEDALVASVGRRESVESRASSSSHSSSSAKLPKLSIKPFSGDPMEFRVFGTVSRRLFIPMKPWRTSQNSVI